MPLLLYTDEQAARDQDVVFYVAGALSLSSPTKKERGQVYVLREFSLPLSLCSRGIRCPKKTSAPPQRSTPNRRGMAESEIRHRQHVFFQYEQQFGVACLRCLHRHVPLKNRLCAGQLVSVVEYRTSTRSTFKSRFREEVRTTDTFCFIALPHGHQQRMLLGSFLFGGGKARQITARIENQRDSRKSMFFHQ